MTYGEEEGEVFLGRSVTQNKEISDQTAQAIDVEVRAIIDRNYERAVQILTDNKDKLTLMAEGLVKYETIDAKQIEEIMAGNEPSPPDDWDSIGKPPSGGPDIDDDGKKTKRRKSSTKKASSSKAVKPSEDAV